MSESSNESSFFEPTLWSMILKAKDGKDPARQEAMESNRPATP